MVRTHRETDPILPFRRDACKNGLQRMARRVLRVSELATMAGLDVDETLILLWDAGLDQYAQPTDKLRRRDLFVAEKAIGLPKKRDLLAPTYWARRLGLDMPELLNLLSELEIPMSPRARTLPRGAVAKLSRHAARHPSLVVSAPSVVIPAPPVESAVDRVQWRTVGQPRALRLLSETEVEGIHWELVQDFSRDADPIDPPGVRNRDLLASAVFRQYTGIGSEAKYPTVEMAAAALFHAIVHDHPFHNGNKRTALVAMLVLLDENGLMIHDACEEDELFQLVLRLAQHRLVPRGRDLPDREVLELAEWIRQRTRAVEKGDRPLQWRRLKQILADIDCQVSDAPANRLNISRTVEEPGLFGRKRKRTLATQVKFTDDGREAQIHTVKKIRTDLWLDDLHGIDSASFYRRGGPAPSGFIVTYRKTLRRLARL